MISEGMMNGGQTMMGWGGMFFGPVMMAGFLGLVVLAVVIIVRWASNTYSRSQGPDDTSLNILKERFAAGDIDAGEFEERRNRLMQ